MTPPANPASSIGTIWAARHEVLVQWTTGTTWVRLVTHAFGRGWSELGIVTDLDTADPRLELTDQHQTRFGEPAVRWQLVKHSQQDWQRAVRRRDDAAAVARV